MTRNVTLHALPSVTTGDTVAEYYRTMCTHKLNVKLSTTSEDLNLKQLFISLLIDSQCTLVVCTHMSLCNLCVTIVQSDQIVIECALLFGFMTSLAHVYIQYMDKRIGTHLIY